MTRAVPTAARAPERIRAFTSRYPESLLAALKVEAKRQGVPVNSYLIERLRSLIDPRSADRRDAVLAKRLRSMDEQIAHLVWSQRALLEAIGALAKVVLGYLPEASTKDEQRAVKDKTDRRSAKFARQVAEGADGRTKGFCAVLDEEFERGGARRESPPLAESAPPEGTT